MMMDEPSANIIMAAPTSSLSVSLCFLTFLLVKKRQSAIFTYAKMKNVRNKGRKKRNMCVREKKKGHASNKMNDEGLGKAADKYDLIDHGYSQQQQ